MKKIIPHLLATILTISSVPVIFSGISNILDLIPEREREIDFDDEDE